MLGDAPGVQGVSLNEILREARDPAARCQAERARPEPRVAQPRRDRAGAGASGAVPRDVQRLLGTADASSSPARGPGVARCVAPMDRHVSRCAGRRRVTKRSPPRWRARPTRCKRARSWCSSPCGKGRSGEPRNARTGARGSDRQPHERARRARESSEWVESPAEAPFAGVAAHQRDDSCGSWPVAADLASWIERSAASDI